jgi:hypothetical protein
MAQTTKKKKKKQGPPIGLLVGIGVGVLLLLIGGGVAATVYLVKTNAAKPAPLGPVAENKDGDAKDGQAKDAKPDGWVPPQRIVVPDIKQGNPAKKGGLGIVNSVRGAGYRAERKHELAELRKAYIMFCDDYKGAARSYENFLNHINTFGPIRDAVKDGYYQMNMKARVDGDNVIAYERDIDSQGHLCVRANGDVVYVPADQLKKELGNP